MVLYGQFLGIPDAKLYLSQPNAMNQLKYAGTPRAQMEARNTASQWMGHPPVPFGGMPAVSMCTFDSECRGKPGGALCYGGPGAAVPCTQQSTCSAQWTCTNDQ